MLRSLEVDARQFFKGSAWWGKLIGAFLGYIMAGPAGAFLGILIGNFFDRGLSEHFSKPHWAYHNEKNKSLRTLFSKTIFAVMGHLAKIDGRVTPQEITFAKLIMQELGLSQRQRELAEAYFKQGKNPAYDLKDNILALRKACVNKPQLITIFIDITYRAAKVKGLTIKKQKSLDIILNYLGFAPLNEQFNFYEDFSYQKHRQQHSSKQNHGQSKPHHALDHAYGILAVAPEANKQEVKRAYRKLLSLHHPDKLIAQGLPEAQIKRANEKTQKIVKAYEEICDYKGW